MANCEDSGIIVQWTTHDGTPKPPVVTRYTHTHTPACHTPTHHANPTHHATALVALATLALTSLALAACTNSGNDIASIGGTSPSGQGSDQARHAEEFFSCMKQANLPAVISDPDSAGERRVTFEPAEGSTIVACGPDGCTHYGKQSVSAESSADAVTADDSADYSDGAFYVDGKDLSGVYQKCLASSGYKEPAFKAEQAEELKDKQAQAKVNAEWTACARDNGLPGLTDPDPPKADNYQTMPTVILPFDVDEAVLAAAIAKCPVFEAEKQAAYDEAIRTDSDSADSLRYRPPSIVLGPAPDGSELDAKEEARITRISDLLYKEQNDYNEQVWKSEG